MSGMLLLLWAYAGGMLTILSPFILPALPFVFARSDRLFRLERIGWPESTSFLEGTCHEEESVGTS
jgi:hypothetical protein